MIVKEQEELLSLNEMLDSGFQDLQVSEDSRRKYATQFLDVNTTQKEGASSESVVELIYWQYLEWKKEEIDVRVTFNLLFIVHSESLMGQAD